ncbi:MAG: ATP-dependent RNA helicase RhlE [Flavobacteriales bacterium]|jgi:ATP-dependent RNA helicase RhlE
MEEITFEDFELNRPLKQAIDDLKYERPTPIQTEAWPIIRSGKNVVGISQTGTGKTTAFMLPLLQDFKYSKQISPRILVIVPTRELVVQIVEEIEKLTKYLSHQIVGVYGGANISAQAQDVQQGASIVVATPGRLYDLVLNGALKLKAIQKLVIDEVDVMLDLGFRFQLTSIFDLLPEKRQNLMFSATMTSDIEELIEEFFVTPEVIEIAVSGTPLDNIIQSSYAVPNFYTKANLLKLLLRDKEQFKKTLVFVASKKSADRLYETIGSWFSSRMSVIHSNKSQNARFGAVDAFEKGKINILIATDVVGRGIDFDGVSHVINIDTPDFPENYMHRIGRTGRAEKKGHSIIFFTENEEEYKCAIEEMMDYEIPQLPLPEDLEISYQKTPEERPQEKIMKSPHRNSKKLASGKAFHDKKDKNKKINLGNSWKSDVAKKYKKPKTRGDKGQNNAKTR